MEHRNRVRLAAAGVVALFVVVQFGALALVEPYVAADAQPVEDPSDPGNVALFFLVILVATAAMLAAIRFDLDQVIRGFVLFACGWITWIVFGTLLGPLTAVAEGAGGLATAAGLLAVGLPILGGGGVVAALWFYPEWYVIDAAGVLLGAGAAGLFGLAFTPQITILFLVVLAAYDAVSVYGTEHMLTLAEGVADLKVPVLLVAPTVPGFSLFDDAGPLGLDDGEESDGQEFDAQRHDAQEHDAQASEAAGTASRDERAADRPDEETPDGEASGRRDAIYIGLGDAVMPTILVASAASPEHGVGPAIDLPLVAATVPAIGAAIGTILGLVVLLWLVLKGRAHAGLPLLNGGAIAGYLVAAVATGTTVATALGLPI